MEKLVFFVLKVSVAYIIMALSVNIIYYVWTIS